MSVLNPAVGALSVCICQHFVSLNMVYGFRQVPLDYVAEPSTLRVQRNDLVIGKTFMFAKSRQLVSGMLIVGSFASK